jgi:choice-of-anchor B domain-containing protein
MYPVLRRFRSAVLIAALLVLTITLFSTWSHLSAQSDDPETPTDSSMTEAMRRFLENREEVEPSEAMGATPCDGGMAGPYPCNNVDLMAFIPYSTFGASYTNDIWGWTDPLDGKEYAIIGVSNGTAFIDITDPVNPVYLGKLPTQTSSSPWRDIKVYNNYAFTVSEASGHGIQIFDLTELRSVVSPPVTFANTDHYNGFGGAHNIVINEDSGYAYGVGTNTCSGGLHMVNIQDPLNATNAGCFSADGYTHDAECVNYAGPDPDYAGAEVCFNSNEDTLTIVDVTNKAAPAQISRTTYPGSDYTHQGWLLDGQRYFILGDEGDEFSFGHNTRTYIWDLLDLDDPQVINNYTGPNDSVDHNMYTIGNLAFQSNYSSGLQILDLSDIANGNLSMAAYFDTYSPNNNASYNGSWSNYPYYDSGVVAVSSIDEGLFIVKPTLEIGILDTDQDEIEATVTVGQSVTRTLTVTNSGNVSFTFTVAEGAAWASVSPSGGTLDPDQSMELSVVMDSSATAGPGDYFDALTFSGTFNNNPGDVDLILHVVEEADYYNYLPFFASDQGGSAAPTPTAALPWLLPLIGITIAAGIGRRKSGK